jgi:hypothetical protein
MRYRLFLHAPDDGQPQGGESEQRDRPSDLLERYGKDALRLAEKLAEAQRDNYRLREKNRMLTTELADAKGKAPADGARVLSKDEAAQWEAYTALGAPAALKTQIDTAQGAQGELAILKRERTIADAAAAQKWPAATLAKLPSLKDKDLIVKDVEIDGTKVKQAFVAHDGKEHPLAEYVTTHDPEFLPALAAEAAIAQSGGGTPFVRQSAGAPPAKQSAITAHLNRTYNRQGAKDNGTNR